MREIKFRCWDKQIEKMRYNCGFFDNAPVFGVALFGKKEFFELMQYTGLKDKNGKEIFEGDIVEWDDYSNGKRRRRCEVIYTPAHYKLIGYYYDISKPDIKTPIEFNCGAFAYEDETEKELEVIGNIYENKNLLTN